MKPRPNQSFVTLGLLLVGCGGASAPSDGERQATAHLVEQAPLQGLTPEAARAVERLGPQVWGHAESGALVGLYGLGLRAVQVEDPLDVEAAEVAVRRFLSEHPALYGVRLEQLQPEALTLETVRQTDRLSFDLQQRSAGLEVTQGLLIVSFDVQGRLQSIVGRLVPQGDLPAVLTPTLSAAEVGAHAMAGAAPGSQLVDARLRIDVARGGLVYDARVLGRTQDEVRVVDASTGEILTTDEQIAHLESERIRMRYYYHPGGSRTLDSQAFTSPLVDIPVINTSWGRLCVYQLQRDRVGGLRIWNGKGITASTPEFSRPQFLRRCGDTSGVFDVAPDSSSDDRFNQQQTYLWAERFADAVDDWGRQANRYGHYPMDTNRPT